MTSGNVCEMECEDYDRGIKKDKMKENILNCVAQSDGFFKSQQLGEEDLTFAQKHEIASKLLDHNVSVFLQRYWKFIKFEDVDYFSFSDDYEINFYLSEIRKHNDSRKSKIIIKNRRFEALKKLVEDGSYFSDNEMKKRNPFLYDQLIGQHLTEKERMDAYKEIHKDDGFSNFLMGQLERNVENCLFEEQKQKVEAVEEEEEEDDDEDESEEESELEDGVTESEKERMRNEFTSQMYESFISGKDKEFDYSSVDNNCEYDPIQGDLDAEEKYFDEDGL